MAKEQADQVQEKPVRSAKEQMIRGSIWMTAGSVFSRVLGAIYVIPWMIWMGSQSAALTANALFTKGYQIYAIFLIISTAGVPGAVSKQVARYNAMNEYKTGLRLFYHGVLAMSVMGVISFGAMWLLAPVLSAGDTRMIPVFQSLAWPLLIIPVLSLIRGFFQGYNEMAPSAISQFIEQVARVIYMLVTVYAIMQLGNHDLVHAVSQSTFAAFIGAIFGLGTLILYFVKQRPRLHRLAAEGEDNLNISVNQILLEVAQQAIPFIIMDSSINLYYIIDQYSFEPMMMRLFNTNKDQLDQIYALFAGNANKLIMIVVSLAVAMAITAVPLLAAAKTRGDVRELANQITNNLQLFFIIMIPSAFGMAAISQPLYVIFYGYNDLGIAMLHFSSFLAILLGLFTVLAAILQGLFNNRLAIIEMLIGFATKIVLQWPLIFFFNVYGPLMATMIGMAVSSYLMLHSMHEQYHFHARQTVRRVTGITAFSLLMYFAVRVIIFGFNQVVNPASRQWSVVMLIVALVVGVAIYGYLVLKTRLAEYVVGARVSGIRRRLHIR
ncbi:putative polysaccharide biosynthesis protein [Lacticaseibacillus saniviri]|uniref:Polysaccharide transport membrane protein n=1 Tax=Lacticaseibacillus saniviri JCM 17471 = DSM 24301 TaxID=1293598 RepID=A0A0R2MX33_9LACO|nr:polysaccharide biosynthesis protein [Lacticaseibacillus saniviri]KRO16800.1 polysaccharide transport membrane protein [Lacticaseibacillus saniviri JCM 17471 = DSM 24301]MCG4283094.1 polysaccharide biosynthesis protein [Lacticaseibacillus saniviri]